MLIATTVIEVGIDVPNATIMLIENAERFGLSQLHQLRGRVGRGSELSYCILISPATSDTAQERLRSMTQTSDGFAIAEMDLKLRGPGEFFGTRQHGLPQLKLADITTELDLLVQAKDDALKILSADPKLAASAHRALRECCSGNLAMPCNWRRLGSRLRLRGRAVLIRKPPTGIDCTSIFPIPLTQSLFPCNQNRFPA